jgi:hypothetical protein
MIGRFDGLLRSCRLQPRNRLLRLVRLNDTFIARLGPSRPRLSPQSQRAFLYQGLERSLCIKPSIMPA